MMHIVITILVEYEIENTDGIYALEFKVPFASWSLLLNRERTVIYASVLEIILFSLLHLDKELLTLFILAINIKHRFAFRCHMTEMLSIEILQIFDHFPPIEKGIKETDQQFLVDLCSKQFLKSEIRIEIYVSFL